MEAVLQFYPNYIYILVRMLLFFPDVLLEKSPTATGTYIIKDVAQFVIILTETLSVLCLCITCILFR